MRATRTLTTLAVLAALGGLPACGSDDATPKSGGTSTGSATDGATSDAAEATTSDLCAAVTDDDISGILGATVTRKEVPGGGCTFSLEDVRAPSITLNTSAFDEGNGGFDAAVAGVSAVIQGPGGGPVDAVGDEAYAKTGTTGGENIQGGGVVHVGGTLVQVTLIQGNGLTAEKVRAIVVDTLTLVAAKA